MNLASAIILAVILIAFFAAVKYTRKHGSCSGCSTSSDGCRANCAGCAVASLEEVAAKKSENQ